MRLLCLKCDVFVRLYMWVVHVHVCVYVSLCVGVTTDSFAYTWYWSPFMPGHVSSDFLFCLHPWGPVLDIVPVNMVVEIFLLCSQTPLFLFACNYCDYGHCYVTFCHCGLIGVCLRWIMLQHWDFERGPVGVGVCMHGWMFWWWLVCGQSIGLLTAFGLLLVHWFFVLVLSLLFLCSS